MDRSIKSIWFIEPVALGRLDGIDDWAKWLVLVILPYFLIWFRVGTHDFQRSAIEI